MKNYHFCCWLVYILVMFTDAGRETQLSNRDFILRLHRRTLKLN